MNGAQIHLAFNHLPIFGVLFGSLFLVVAVVRNSVQLKQAGLWLCLAAAVGAVPAYLAGEPAEDVVLNVAGIEEERIEAHEEMALIALIGTGILGAASLAGLYLSRKSGAPPDMLVIGCLVLSLVALVILGWTAHLGGQIHHPEIRPGFQAMLPLGAAFTRAVVLLGCLIPCSS
jgi:uncharacterized membrane protein